MTLDNHEDNDAWKIELENALLEGCTANQIFSISQGRPLPENLRAEVWQTCVDVQDKGNQMIHFNEIFDLPNQTILREDCLKAIEHLGNDDEDKVSVTSDLESIITYYSKCRKFNYEPQNGWIELLLPLLALKLPKSNTFNLFEAICDNYIPKGCYKNGSVCHVLRLLLLYHDPELCSVLDTKRITPDQFSLSWFQTLFASKCSLPVILNMWDLYFQQADPFFIFFLALVMIVNARDTIIAKKNDTRQSFIDILANMPCALEADDVADFCSLAQYYAMKTPVSFKIDLLPVLFRYGHDISNDETLSYLSQLLCLPVTAQELVENVSMEISSNVDTVRFFLVDCRPVEQYNAGHLPTAFHLDSNLMLQEPSAFATAVQGLLNAQRQALAANSNAGGEHLCFLGSGRMEEDQYAHMVVASFLQKHTQYVSMLTGGYKAIHDYFGDEVSSCLQDHSMQNCLVCCDGKNYNDRTSGTSHSSPILKSSQSIDLFGKISSVMKTKSAEVKGKLIDYIVNPNNSSTIQVNNSAASQIIDRHVSSTDKIGKRYRNVAPVFSIDDENDNGHSTSVQSFVDDDETTEIVTIKTWLNRPDVVEWFKCEEVKINGYMYPSFLLVTDSHLIVLREMPGRKNLAQVMVRRPLSSIIRITAKKRHPELITFKYGDSETYTVSDMDKFLIPDANKATKVITQQIVNYVKEKRWNSWNMNSYIP